MGNWYKKIAQDIGNKSKWSFSVEAQVFVPRQINEEEEKETARKVLKSTLNKIEGDVSQYTAIDSNIMFDIQFEPLKI